MWENKSIKLNDNFITFKNFKYVDVAKLNIFNNYCHKCKGNLKFIKYDDVKKTDIYICEKCNQEYNG